MSKEIFRCVYGSRLFGTNLPESDEDFRAVVLPSRADILLGNAEKITQVESRKRANVAGDVDKTDLTVQAFLGLLEKSEVTAIETLFAPALYSTAEWDLIAAHKKNLVCANVNKFVGFSKAQISRYAGRGKDLAAAQSVLAVLDTIPGKKRPVADSETVLERLRELCDKTPGLEMSVDEKHPTVPILTLSGRSSHLTQGVGVVRSVFQKVVDRAGQRTLDAAQRQDKTDYKGLYHAVRILLQGEELLNTGEIRFPLESTPLLLRVRSGEFSAEACAEMCDVILERINAAQKTTQLPAAVSGDLITDLILELHSKVMLSADREMNIDI